MEKRMGCEPFMPSVFHMSPVVLIGRCAWVCVCVSFPWLPSHSSPPLVLGNPAHFLPLTTSLSAKQNNIFEMGCLSGQRTAPVAHRGPSFKGIAEWAHLMKARTVCLTWFTGNGQLIRRTGLGKPVGCGDECLCSSVVPTEPFAAWGLEYKRGSDKGLWNLCLAQGALTAQEIDI